MKRFTGLLILGVAIAVVVFYALRKTRSTTATDSTTTSTASSVKRTDVTAVKGYAGGEKAGFLDDPTIKSILAQRYGLSVDSTKRGSIEMVSEDAGGQDFLWPSSQFAAEVFRKRQSSSGAAEAKSETIFNSPIVFYSWALVTDGLQNQKLLEKRDETYYLSDAPAFIKLITSGKRWKEIGIPQLYGRVTIYSTDPNRSNSGTMFAALLATLLNDGDVPDETNVSKQLPAIRQFFGRMGYMEGSSGDLFKQFLNTGVGANPIIVAYENQMIEYGLEHQDQVAMLRQNVRVIYPQPTMWSSHPFIALTANGRKLLEALKDRDIQRLAWERHGFRSGLAGVENDTRALKIGGVPARIESVVPMPNSTTMLTILESLRGSTPASDQSATGTTR